MGYRNDPEVPDEERAERDRERSETENREPNHLPIDAPEADALDQARDAELDDEEHGT